MSTTYSFETLIWATSSHTNTRLLVARSTDKDIAQATSDAIERSKRGEHMRSIVDALGGEKVLEDTRVTSDASLEAALDALEPFVDNEPCDLDSQGGCQAHNSFGDGECHVARARRILAAREQPLIDGKPRVTGWYMAKMRDESELLPVLFDPKSALVVVSYGGSMDVAEVARVETWAEKLDFQAVVKAMGEST